MKQSKSFAKLLTNLKHKPNEFLINAIDNKDFPLNNNKVFGNNTEVLAIEEYKRCLSLLERRMPQIYEESLTQKAIQLLQLSMMPIMNSIFVKEMNHRKELEQIAEETIRELFDIPNHITILPKITDNFLTIEGQDEIKNNQPSLSPERKKEIDEEIEKRIILNGIVHGCSMHIWKSVYYIIKDKIDNINSSLMELYNIYTASIGWGIWQMNPETAMDDIDINRIAQGVNELKFEEKNEAECTINCSGINFPVLLHEISKGAIDYLICHSIPIDYTPEELTYYYSKADIYKNEYWHYLLSPSIWVSLIETANVTTQELPSVIANLSKLNYQNLSDVINSCVKKDNSKLKEFQII